MTNDDLSAVDRTGSVVVDYSQYEALAPFMKLMEQMLDGIAEGQHYFDLFAEDMVMEFPYAPPGTPPAIQGRATMIDAWRRYGEILHLDRMSNPTVFRTDKTGVVILEYESHGRGVKTGLPYHQTYVSIVTVRDGKIVHWRDYSSPLVVINTIGGSEHMAHAMFSEA